MVNQLRDILESNPLIASQISMRLAHNAAINPSYTTNPVRSIKALYTWLQHFLTCLPWEGLNLPNHSVFRRIDQSIGYVYYLFGKLQYNPLIAKWLIAYNEAWADWLHSNDSWNEDCYELVKTDPLFELTTDKYESPDNWHCWNDFFCRRLAPNKQFQGVPLADGIVAPSEGDILDAPIKTMDHYVWADLLGDSPYRAQLVDAKALHLSLDMYHYHRLHAPTNGRIVDLRIIPGMHLDGGRIIWDEQQHRYRYANSNNTNFQALETRGVMVIERDNGLLLAVVAVGVAQISSVNWAKDIQIGTTLTQGQEIGHFACGGSDVVVLYNE